jgi:hypothetical protein
MMEMSALMMSVMELVYVFILTIPIPVTTAFTVMVMIPVVVEAAQSTPEILVHPFCVMKT